MNTATLTSRSVAAAAGALGLALALAACGGSSAEPATSESVAAQPTTSSEATPTTAPEPLPTPAADFSALPADVAPGSDAAVAWEALMGVDGEYAAAASYAAVIDTFGQVEPYVTIKAAEERHSDALIRQLDRLGVQAPANPYLGQVSAPADLTSAAQAWADGEVLNVQMYDELLTQTSDPNLVKVLNNLRRASLDSHLPTFQAAAASGGTLTAEQMAALPTG